MPAVEFIVVEILTGNRPGASIGGTAFLGIGGREFRLESRFLDFQTGGLNRFTLGATVVETGNDRLVRPEIRAFNDPQQQDQLLSETLHRFPAYIRYAPRAADENWNIERVTVEVFADVGTVGMDHIIRRVALWQILVEPENHLWLGNRSGLYLYLEPILAQLPVIP